MRLFPYTDSNNCYGTVTDILFVTSSCCLAIINNSHLLFGPLVMKAAVNIAGIMKVAFTEVKRETMPLKMCLLKMCMIDHIFCNICLAIISILSIIFSSAF